MKRSATSPLTSACIVVRCIPFDCSRRWPGMLNFRFIVRLEMCPARSIISWPCRKADSSGCRLPRVFGSSLNERLGSGPLTNKPTTLQRACACVYVFHGHSPVDAHHTRHTPSLTSSGNQGHWRADCGQFLKPTEPRNHLDALVWV